MEHQCHLPGCGTPTHPSKLFCLRHWRMTPPALKKRVWDEYRRGQEVSKNPSPAYCRAVYDAIVAVLDALQVKDQGIRSKAEVWARLATKLEERQRLISGSKGSPLPPSHGGSPPPWVEGSFNRRGGRGCHPPPPGVSGGSASRLPRSIEESVNHTLS